jgi:glycosyltransferase involved in cell wall biosynthesis
MREIVRRDFPRDTVSRRLTTRITVIPSFRDDTEQAPKFGSRDNLLPERPFILFVGALQPHKGLNVLLEAYRRLTSPPPLVLIGTTWPDTPREFPVGVQVIRDAPHEIVMDAWERCLFGVAPSVWPEPFGNIIHEGMSRSKAVIATQIGGPTDMIVHGESGVLVPPGDVPALVEAMQALISSPEYRGFLGRAARIRAELFTANKIVPRFDLFYRAVLDGFVNHVELYEDHAENMP